ncbi:MAG: DEAD/DEAH box helicase [Caldilineaceae bacterium]|nr:DEAD/DEAH box helicase [Caldilineaceae bacterium]
MRREFINRQKLSNSLPHSLRPYQWEGVDFLRFRQSALLADEMGLGKTVQTAVALRACQEEFRRVLLVTPTSLCLNWQRELETWANGLAVRRVIGNADDRAMTYRLPIQVLIASYEQIRTDSRKFHGAVSFDLVVLDEAQRIKNLNSATSFACRLIPRSRSWALTGTPLENQPQDLVAIFRYLKPQLLHASMSRAEMHEAMTGYFLRRTKEEVLGDLPPILTKEIRLELGQAQRQTYENAWNSRLNAIPHADSAHESANMLAILTKLKQLCNFDLESGESAKLDVIRPLLDTVVAKGEKVLIFSQYVSALEWLSERIEIPHLIYHGGLSPDVKESVLDAFRKQDGPQALLMSLQAGGVGLNLQEASMVILLDRWWNPAIENQAIQRAHRFGRKVPLQVVRFLVENSVEERILDILKEKRGLFEEYVEAGPKSLVYQTKYTQLKRILDLNQSQR